MQNYELLVLRRTSWILRCGVHKPLIFKSIKGSVEHRECRIWIESKTASISKCLPGYFAEPRLLQQFT